MALSAAERDVLVVDDSPQIRETLTQLLQEEGYQVRTANNGREALDEVQRSMPQAILLDLMMPIMDGWEFAEALKKLPGGKEPRLLLLSANRGVELSADGLRADDWLGKPFEVSMLLDKVAKAVSTPRAALELGGL